MQMSPTCSRKDKVVVPNRFVVSLLPDSMRLSSNIGFSYIRPLRELRHRPRPLCSRSLEPCLCELPPPPAGSIIYAIQQFPEKLKFCTSGHPFSDAVSCSKIRPI